MPNVILVPQKVVDSTPNENNAKVGLQNVAENNIIPPNSMEPFVLYDLKSKF
uniref:Uncharacterized protein n=1 Tax=Rhizophagus irregularis (strain DAOM 181602 / DAOM 197198 / MUCL 43194) TaxID=747089 RepID=U9T9J2_RHIID